MLPAGPRVCAAGRLGAGFGGVDVLFPILSRCLSLFAVALLSAMWANPAHAWSTAQLTLQEFIDGETFNTGNGLLFSDFEAVFTGDLADQIDASDIEVIVVDDGFQLTGPMSAADGEIGDIAALLQR